MWIHLPGQLLLAAILTLSCITPPERAAIAPTPAQPTANPTAAAPQPADPATATPPAASPDEKASVPAPAAPSDPLPPVGEKESKEPVLTKQQIEKQLQTVQNDQQLDDKIKAELQKRYEAALEWLKVSEEAQKKVAQYKAEIEGVSESVVKAKMQLASTSSTPSLTFPAETTLQEMEQKLSQAELKLREASAELTKREEELKRRNERKAELTKLIDEARQRIDAAKKQLISQPTNAETPELASARKTELQTHLTALEQQLQRYLSETQRHDALADLLPLQRDLAQREKNLLEKQVAAYRDAVASKRKAESERQAQETRETKQQLADSHPTLRDLAERNDKLAKRHESLAESITKFTQEVTHTEQTLADLEADFDTIQEKVRYAGNSSSIGSELRKKRSELPDINKCQQRIRFVSRTSPDEYLEWIKLREERATLGDLDMAVADLDWSQPPSHEQDEPEQIARQLLEKKRDLLDTLINNDYDQYLFKLSKIETLNNQLITQTEAFTNYIDERVLWVRSAKFLGINTVKDMVKGLLELAKPGPWIELSKQCGWDAIKRPSVILLVVTAFGILIAVQTSLRRRLQNLCVTTSGSAPLKMRLTLEGLFLTATMAIPLPLFLLLVGWWLTRAEGISDIGLAIGWGLRYSAILLWVVQFTRVLCRPGLLAESHFGWSSYSLAIARRHLRWLVFCGAPLFFMTVVADRYHTSTLELENSLGRIAFIGLMVLLAVFMHIVLFSKNNVLREIVACNPDHWVARFSFFLYLFAVGLPLLLAGLAWSGYYYSARQLALQLEETLSLVLGLVLIHATVSRWFLVKRRNLAIAQMRARQAQEAESSPNIPVVVPVSSTQQNLSAIHQQLHYLLGYAIVVCFMIGSWMIWADTFPALKVLDNQKLWDNTIEVVEVHEDPLTGEPVKQLVPVEAPTTARHALMATIILFAAVVIGRHLPALIQITLLSRVHFDKGGRHAISILMRYLVALIGVILACRMMNITWGSVQWLAAGITVGLGFGLQEIFANFISGLILLFERPIRVGDIITLDDTTGMVTDIRIRTTTVTNWDRKELIVPNKELITGRLLNWTLSDPVNRIVVTVGVAYKTDTRKVHDLVMQIATEHSNVLEDPEPQVTFESFGDSALNFVLRCYIASMETRLSTVHDIHEAIHDRFNQEGIEIAFPQRDLHIRTVEQKIPQAITAPEKKDESA